MKKQISLKKNILMNVLLTMSSFIFQLITFPYASRVLSPTGLGKTSFAISLMSYFVLFSQLGIPTYGVVTCAKIRDNKSELSQTVKELLFINLITSFITYVFFIFILLSVPKLAADKRLYLFASITILLNACGMEWLYRALEQYDYITKRSVVFKIIAVILMFLFVHREDDYTIYTLITVLASSGSQVLNLAYSRKFINWKLINPFDSKRLFAPKRHLKFILVFFLMSCATTIYTHMDSVMLGFICNDEIVGFYNAAVKIKTFLIAIVTSISGVLLPRTSYYIKNKAIDQFRIICQKSLYIVFILGLSFVVFFSIFAKNTILFLSGESYLNSIKPMLVITPTVLFIGLTNITGIQMLVPMGKEKTVLLSEVMGAVTNLILNSLLIPQLGAIGASLGTLVAEFVVLLVQFIAIRYEIFIAFKGFPFVSFFIVIIISGFIAVFFKKLIYNNFLALVLSGAIYFGSVLLWIVMSGTLKKLYRS